MLFGVQFLILNIPHWISG